MFIRYLKIFGVLVFSYFSSWIIVKNVFIGNTPQPDPNFASRFKMSFSNIAWLNFKKEESPTFQPIGNGVYAGEENKTKVVKFVENEIAWQTYTFLINGREIKIKIPVGKPTPSKELLEKIYK